MKHWKLPRLSRGWRIVRNLTLVLLLLTYLWVQSQCPIRNIRLDFRRAERNNLIGPCEIQGIFDTYRENWVTAVSGDQAILWGGAFREMNYWPRQTGQITLVPVPTQSIYQFRGETGIVAVDVPPEARSARLELTVSCWYVQTVSNGWSYMPTLERLVEVYGETGPAQYWEKIYQSEGERLKDGAFLFRLAAEGPRDDQGEGHSLEFNTFARTSQWESYRYGNGAAYHMDAVFYGEDGQELGRAALATPEDGDSTAG